MVKIQIIKAFALVESKTNKLLGETELFSKKYSNCPIIFMSATYAKNIRHFGEKVVPCKIILQLDKK